MKRLLVLESDPTTRALVVRVLASTGARVVAPASASSIPTASVFDAALVDERSGHGALLCELESIRARFPLLPIVLTGTLLSSDELKKAIRLGVTETVTKPFAPDELRDAVERACSAGAPDRRDALDYAAAIAEGCKALFTGQPADARAVLARAHALSPLDAEAMALEALAAELEGRDGDADRGYRAALALRHDEHSAPPHPLDGLARLGAYGDARPVARLPSAFREAPTELVVDASALSVPPTVAEALSVVVLSLGLDHGEGTLYLRAGARRAFVIATAGLAPEQMAKLVGALEFGEMPS